MIRARIPFRAFCYEGRVGHYFFVGIATVLLTGFLRYVDLIGDYIGGSVLFIVMALVLLGAARLWKHLKQEKTGQSLKLRKE